MIDLYQKTFEKVKGDEDMQDALHDLYENWRRKNKNPTTEEELKFFENLTIGDILNKKIDNYRKTDVGKISRNGCDRVDIDTCESIGQTELVNYYDPEYLYIQDNNDNNCFNTLSCVYNKLNDREKIFYDAWRDIDFCKDNKRLSEIFRIGIKATDQRKRRLKLRLKKLILDNGFNKSDLM